MQHAEIGPGLGEDGGGVLVPPLVGARKGVEELGRPKLLHLGDEDVVSLLLDELVFFNLPRDGATDFKTFARVFLDISFGSVNSALDVERLQFELIDDVGRARLLWLRTEQSQVVHLELVREHAQFLCS